jgi:spermidine synthase
MVGNPELRKACIVAFIAGFSTMVVEIVAGRILAPRVGVSLYTWTSIIAVVLTGIATGAGLGGVLADRYPRASILGWTLALSGLSVLSIPPLLNWVGGVFFSTGLIVRILLVTSTIFFAPSFFLGMVLPVAVKLAVSNVDRSGNVIGRIYASSAIGSILGTFATGFFLISWMGTRNLLFATAIILLLCAPLLAGFFNAGRRGAFLLILVTLLWPLHHYAFKPVLDGQTFFFEESNYYTIELRRGYSDGRGRLATLYLDHLTHSTSDPDDPSYLQYRYIRSYREVVEWRVGRNKSFKALFIGGGGYTFPRYLEARYPNAEIDVIEIDPAVTRVSRKFLGLSPNTRIRTFNEDARWFALSHRGEEVYDFIFEDAFHDISIPYHLTTKEFSLDLRRLLKNDGLLLTNVIDRFERGAFLPSYIRTLAEVFGRNSVHLITLGSHQTAGVENRVVIAGPDIRSMKELTRKLAKIKAADRISYVMSHDLLWDHLDRFRPVILTDDYVPVDNMTAPNFL